MLQKRIISSEEEFIDECYFSASVNKFVEENTSDDEMWFFSECVRNDDLGKEFIIFYKSYESEGYENYTLTIKVELKDDDCNITLVRKVTE